jgi:hypothetical protein
MVTVAIASIGIAVGNTVLYRAARVGNVKTLPDLSSVNRTEPASLARSTSGL